MRNKLPMDRGRAEDHPAGGLLWGQELALALVLAQERARAQERAAAAAAGGAVAEAGAAEVEEEEVAAGDRLQPRPQLPWPPWFGRLPRPRPPSAPLGSRKVW